VPDETVRTQCEKEEKFGIANRPYLGIFIASASEGLDVANAIRDVLKSSRAFAPRVWNESTFEPGMTFIEA